MRRRHSEAERYENDSSDSEQIEDNELREMYDGIGTNGLIKFGDFGFQGRKKSTDQLSDLEKKKAVPVLTTAAINAMYQQ